MADEAEITTRYINCFYFIVVTLATVGYGDFTAQTNNERVAIIFIALVACGNFAYSLNQIGYIM